jgi:molybdate/tungstate transport system ATP-binding protein
MRDELKRVKDEFGITMMHVTHDQTEAMLLADRIAVMIRGRIVQVGTPQEIFNKPLNEELADFVGIENILAGVIRSNEQGIAEINVDSSTVVYAVSEFRDGAVKAFVRPENIILSTHMDQSSARNVVKGQIERIHEVGPLVRVRLDNGLVALITRQARDELSLQLGGEVFATFKATAVHVVRA